MNEYTILVPRRFNDGTKVPKSQFVALERKLIQSFNGYTCHGTVSGAWQNEEGTLFTDKSRRYAVAADDISQIEAIAREVAKDWEQEAIYIAQTSDRVEFVVA